MTFLYELVLDKYDTLVVVYIRNLSRWEDTLGKVVSRARQARLAYALRLGRSVSVQEVAKQIGVTRAFLSNVERSKAWPSKKVIEGLCALYGVKPGDLFDLEDRQPPALAGGWNQAPALG